MPSTNDSALPTLAAASAALRRGELSPVELTERCLARIEYGDATLHAFTTVTADHALNAARQAEIDIARGRWRGPLHGVPIGLKDVIDMAGVPTLAQSEQRIGACAARDAAVTTQLHNAGAILLGKLTTHEFAFGKPETNAVGEPARNPWHTAHFAGGSSSGAAVAVASQMLLGAIGTDTAGSIRSPAALCGVAGLKPTRHWLDQRGVIPLAPSLDTLGLIAATVEDCALLFSQLVPQARVIDEHAALQLDHSVRGLRLGVVRHFYSDDRRANDDMIAAIESAIGEFTRLGLHVHDAALPPLQHWHAAGVVTLLGEAFAQHESLLRTQPEKYGTSFREAMRLGAAIGAADYARAQTLRSRLSKAVDRAFDDCDVLITAIQPGAAPRLDAVGDWGFIEQPSYGMPFNLSDHPALALCCGFSDDGLPLGLQLIGRRDDEATLLRVGHAYERATQWRRCRPPPLY